MVVDQRFDCISFPSKCLDIPTKISDEPISLALNYTYVFDFLVAKLTSKHCYNYFATSISFHVLSSRQQVAICDVTRTDQENNLAYNCWSFNSLGFREWELGGPLPKGGPQRPNFWILYTWFDRILWIQFSICIILSTCIYVQRERPYSNYFIFRKSKGKIIKIFNDLVFGCINFFFRFFSLLLYQNVVCFNPIS